MDYRRETVPTSDPRPLLWRNICTLMRDDEPSIDAVQARTKIGRGTVQRIRDGDTGTRLTSLVAIAEAFGLEVWQLLSPALADIGNEPPLSLTPDERAVVMTYRQHRQRGTGGEAAVNRMLRHSDAAQHEFQPITKRRKIK